MTLQIRRYLVKKIALKFFKKQAFTTFAVQPTKSEDDLKTFLLNSGPRYAR